MSKSKWENRITNALVNLQPGQAFDLKIRRRYEAFDYVNHRWFYVKPPDGWHVAKTLNRRIRLMNLDSDLEATWVGKRLLLIRKQNHTQIKSSANETIEGVN